jgi:hypothetical protein
MMLKMTAAKPIGATEKMKGLGLTCRGWQGLRGCICHRKASFGNQSIMTRALTRQPAVK